MTTIILFVIDFVLVFCVYLFVINKWDIEDRKDKATWRTFRLTRKTTFIEFFYSIFRRRKW